MRRSRCRSLSNGAAPHNAPRHRTALALPQRKRCPRCRLIIATSTASRMTMRPRTSTAMDTRSTGNSTGGICTGSCCMSRISTRRFAAPHDPTITKEEVAPASGGAPHRGVKSHRAVWTLNNGPAWAARGKKIELDDIPTPTRTDHRRDPEMPVLSNEIHRAIAQGIGNLCELLSPVRLRLTPEERAEPRPGEYDPFHVPAPRSLSAGISSRGRTSPRPTCLDNDW